MGGVHGWTTGTGLKAFLANYLPHVSGGRRGSREELKGRRTGMVQPDQQHVAPFVNGVEWGLGNMGG